MFTKKLIVIVLTALLFLYDAGVAEEIQKKAIIGYLKGSVKVTKKTENISVPAKLGMLLLAGDKIETGTDSKVELKLEDGSTFRVADNTSIVIQDLKQEDSVDRSTIEVIFGRIWININKAIGSNPVDSKTVTKKVYATVKGTTFRADVDKEGETVINVYDGTVGVAKDKKEDKATKFEKINSRSFLKTKFDEAEDAKDDWVKWNKNRDKIRVMVVFSEKKNGQLSVIPLSEVIFSEELLKNYLYSVIDQSTLNQIRSNEKLKSALAEDEDGKKAAAAGLEFGADIIITGQVDAAARQTEAGYGMYTGISDMSIRTVKCDTAELITAKNSQKRTVDIMEQGAFNNSVRRASKALVESINNDIVKSRQKEALKGSSLYISLYNVTFEKIEVIRNALSGISGVKNVNQISFVGGRALLSVIFSGGSLSLAEKAAKMNIKDIKLDVVGLSLNRVEIEIK